MICPTVLLSRTGCVQVFDQGALFDPMVLDIKDEDLLANVTNAIAQVAAFSLEANYPTIASIPHSVVNGYKNVLAIAVETDYSFELAEKVRIYRMCMFGCSSKCDAVL